LSSLSRFGNGDQTRSLLIAVQKQPTLPLSLRQLDSNKRERIWAKAHFDHNTAIMIKHTMITRLDGQELLSNTPFFAGPLTDMQA
jgi:hypothetical protein